MISINKGRKMRDFAKRDSAMRFSTSGFFMNQFLPSPKESQEGHFECFRKFAEIFTAQKIQNDPNAIFRGLGDGES